MEVFRHSILGLEQYQVRCRVPSGSALLWDRYYEENKEKFDFYTYELIDWDEVTEHLPKIDMEQFFKELAKPLDNE